MCVFFLLLFVLHTILPWLFLSVVYVYYDSITVRIFPLFARVCVCVCVTCICVFLFFFLLSFSCVCGFFFAWIMTDKWIWSHVWNACYSPAWGLLLVLHMIRRSSFVRVNLKRVALNSNLNPMYPSVSWSIQLVANCDAYKIRDKIRPTPIRRWPVSLCANRRE